MLSQPAAIWDRPALWTQTNRTLGLVMRVSSPDRGSGSAGREHTADAAACSTNTGTDAGAMPANVSESVRATVTAGLAKLVELVNQ